MTPRHAALIALPFASWMLACARPHVAPPARVSVVMSPTPPPAALDATSPPPSPAPTHDALRGLGPLHHPLIALNDMNEFLPRVQLAFIGPPDHVDATWLVFDPAADGRRLRRTETAGEHLVEVHGWPPGVAVVDVVRSDALARTYVLVESTAGASAPMGTRGVVEFTPNDLLTSDFSSFSIARDYDWVEMRGVTSTAEFRAAIAVRQSRLDALVARERDAMARHIPLPSDTDDPVECAALIRTAARRGSWIDVLDPEGLDVAYWRLGVMPGPAQHFARSAVARSPLADAIRSQILATLRQQSVCRGRVGELWVSERDEGPPRIRAVMLAPPTAPRVPRQAGANEAVTAVEPPAEARAALRANVRDELQSVSAAPTDDGLLVVGYDGQSIGALSWRGHAGSFQSIIVGPDVPREVGVAYVHLAGDPHTAVVVRTRLSDQADRAPAYFTLAYRPAWRSDPNEAHEDAPAEMDSAYWMVGSRDLPGAVDALVRAPVGAIPSARACEVLARAADRTTWRAAVMHEARWLAFEEPGLPTFVRETAPMERLPRVACGRVRCSAEAPHCVAGEGLSERDYWFRRDQATWRLAGFAVYVGS